MSRRARSPTRCRSSASSGRARARRRRHRHRGGAMTELHVLRVFVGPDGRGGNPLGVFLDGAGDPGRASPGGRRPSSATRRRSSSTIPAKGAIRIFTPGAELPFAGHPTRRDRLAVPRVRGAGDDAPAAGRRRPVPPRRRAHVDPGASPSGSIRSARRSSTSAAEVDAPDGPAMGEPGIYVWAWLDEPAGDPRALLRHGRRDPGGRGDRHAAVVMGGVLGRADRRFARASGPRSCVRPQPDGTVEIGGRVALVDRRTTTGAGGSWTLVAASSRDGGSHAGRLGSPRAPRVGCDRRGARGDRSAAAYWLSRRLGDRVLGLEQFELGHSRGAGQDHSRIIRLSYHRPDYVRLARRAYRRAGPRSRPRAGPRS